ncbi:alkylation response protein AidB-like acyl-CoA dehydrogenase [Pseudochelatococcus lubricantis]|uniref:Alkylation response protein AidB-like acyl-CoA dehydrogenase n=2 Tax=Pseudochelatococcus lubricantis TaxID=1538102 RepID=A0ABX0V153_9HYPH|nr:acyl-CoA dehydrogenase family protein [Pseudochelatococcus lubricantis]NIJ58923.1 alkylation response protein AidB-like acyl-CoA dehydrogenase [Pseudochelatococcus lubricantis]
MTVLDRETATLLRDAVAKHAERHADGAAIRSRRATLPGPRAAELAEMAQQGWLALAMPEDGGGLGIAAAAVVAEGLAGCFTSDPLAGLFLAGRVLALTGAEPDLMDGLAAGTAQPVLAWQEGPQDFPLPSAKTICAGGKASGGKGWIAGAAGASHFIVSASDDGEPVLVLAAADAPGLVLTQQFRADGSAMGRLDLRDVPVRELARGEAAAAPLRRALDEGSVLVAAELMGHIDRMMALTIEHLKTRRQFGKPIGAFQSLQHRAADMFVRRRLARAVLEAGLSRLDALPDAAAHGMQAARLRARLNDSALWIMRESIQLFGAMGITDENDLGLHVKRCLSLIGWLGNSAEQRRYFMDLAAPGGRLAEGGI